MDQEVSRVEGEKRGENNLKIAQHSDSELSLLLKLKNQGGSRRDIMNFTYPSLKKYALV